MRPFFSASSIMFFPIRSFTLLHGSCVSSLQATRAFRPLVTYRYRACEVSVTGALGALEHTSVSDRSIRSPQK